MQKIKKGQKVKLEISLSGYLVVLDAGTHYLYLHKNGEGYYWDHEAAEGEFAVFDTEDIATAKAEVEKLGFEVSM